MSESRLITAEKNLKKLLSMIGQATEEVEVISPWVCGGVLSKLIEALPSDTSMNVTVRWPQAGDSPEFLDLDEIQQVMANEQVTVNWIGNGQSLHAKVYSVEGQGAIVSSANLTGRGFPVSENQPYCNLEAGVYLRGKPHHEIIDWIGDLDREELEQEHLTSLRKWKSDYEHWERQCQERPNPPSPPEPPPRVSFLALEYAKKACVIRGFEHIQRGQGRKAFFLDIDDRHARYPVRVLTSVRKQQPISGYELSYHFDLPLKDIKAWWAAGRKRGNHVRGFVLVPVVERSGRREFDTSSLSPEPVFLPMSRLLGRGSFPIKEYIKAPKRAISKKFYLSKAKDGRWFLQRNLSKTLPLDVTDYCLNTRKITTFRQYWSR